MSQVPHFNMTIAGHELTLLAVDGVDVQEVNISSINLHAGERYDFRLCANQKRGSYKITAEALDFCDPAYLTRTGQPMPLDKCQFFAFLHYKALFSGYPKRPKHGLIPDGVGGGKTPRRLSSPALDLGQWHGYGIVKPLDVPPLHKLQPDTTIALDLGSLE